MRNLMGSECLRGLLVLVLALVVAQCGGDDEFTGPGDSGPSEPQCANEDLTAGTYSFTIVDQSDDCGEMFSLLAELGLIPPGPYTFVLPGYDSLPQSVTIELPLPGSPQVNGELRELSGKIVLTVQGTTQVTIDLDLPQVPPGLPDSIDITVAIGGTVCPISETRVNTDLAITLTEAVPPFTSGGCTIEATLRGFR